jgi:hypothetical protein
MRGATETTSILNFVFRLLLRSEDKVNIRNTSQGGHFGAHASKRYNGIRIKNPNYHRSVFDLQELRKTSAHAAREFGAMTWGSGEGHQ